MLNRQHVTAGVTLAIFQAFRSAAHGTHAAFTIIEHNQGAGTLEVIHRPIVFDLESALTARTGQTIRMEDIEDGNTLVGAYIDDYFSVSTADGLPITMEWVGMALETDTLFVCQETLLPANLTGLVIPNQMLTETHPSQMNIVNITFDGRAQSRIFTLGDPPKTISIT